MELNFWQSTECQHAQFNEKTQEWTVKVARDGKEMVLRPKQLVLATGMSGVPHIPQIRGANTFKGVQHHSSGEEYGGQKCVMEVPVIRPMISARTSGSTEQMLP